jgi:hypothetical protein
MREDFAFLLPPDETAGLAEDFDREPMIVAGSNIAIPESSLPPFSKRTVR